MARTKKIFSPEEIDQLQQSPYVKAVTPYIVSFTAEFKTKFWEIYKYTAPRCQHNFLQMLSYVLSPEVPVLFLEV